MEMDDSRLSGVLRTTASIDTYGGRRRAASAACAMAATTRHNPLCMATPEAS